METVREHNLETDSRRAEAILSELNIIVRKNGIMQIVASSDPANNHSVNILNRIGWNQISQMTKDFYDPPPNARAGVGGYPQSHRTIKIMPNIGNNANNISNINYIDLTNYSRNDAEKVYAYLLRRVMEHGD
jgi:hypothetical protein